MRILAALTVSALLAGCAQSQVTGSLFYLKPYKYEDLSCEDLKKKAAAAEKDVKDYQTLHDKAAQSAGGGAIGSLVYNPQYQRASWDQHFYEDEYARRNCTNAPPTPPPAPAAAAATPVTPPSAPPSSRAPAGATPMVLGPR